MTNNLPAPVPAPAVSLKDIRRDSTKFPRLSAYDRATAVRHMGELVTQAVMYKGMEVVPDKVAFTASALYDELMTDPDGIGTAALSFEEIRRVFRQAVLGQGRELYGVSVSTLYAALADYVKGPGHLAQVEANNEAKTARMNQRKINAAAVMADAYAARLVQHSNTIKK